MIPAAPSSQKVAVQALMAALPGLNVSTQMPRARPAEHVIVSRIGGGDGPFGTVAPRFLVEVYGSDELAAEELAERVRRAWLGLRSHGINWSTDDGNLTPYESPDVDHVRFQFTGGLQIIL